MSDGVFFEGEEGFEKKSKIDHVTKTKKEKGVGRFWLKADDKSVVVFLDSKPTFIYEHNLKIEGRWGNFFTCTKQTPAGCPICQKGIGKPVFTAYLTCIDTKQFVRKDGTISKNRKVLYGAKGPTINKLKTIIKNHTDLRGKAFEIYRATGEEPNCGRDIDFIKDVDISKLEDTIPYDYKTVLAVPTADEYADLGIVVGLQAEDEAKPAPEEANIEDLF